MKALPVGYLFYAETAKRSDVLVCSRWYVLDVLCMHFVSPETSEWYQDGLWSTAGVRCPLVRSVRACMAQLLGVLHYAFDINYCTVTVL